MASGRLTPAAATLTSNNALPISLGSSLDFNTAWDTEFTPDVDIKRIQVATVTQDLQGNDKLGSWETIAQVVQFFDPDYLAIGIEVNEIHPKSAEKWAAYVALHRHVYQELKAAHPDLPVFASFTLHNMIDWQGTPNDTMIAAFDELMPYNDMVGMSFYPFIGGLSPRIDESFAWMTGHFDAFAKPYVVTETGEAAEELVFPSTGQVIANTPEMQRAYYARVLALAQERAFPFVISFLYRDYDALWEKIKDGSPEFFMAWRDCGLVDEAGVDRPARALWQTAFDRPLTDAR